MSDLHLSEGRLSKSKKFSPNEDFFFDEEFARFLDYHKHGVPGRPADRKWHLLINGDFLDFLQVTSYKDAPEGLSRDPRHPEYGLGCGAPETVYKLGKIMDGHWLFFEALAEFVADGNLLTIGKGNHDVEFHYEEVRKAFRRLLRNRFAQKLDRVGDPHKDEKLARLPDDSIRFIDWFYYEKGLLWVEHGNQYDGLNNFKYWLCPLLPNTPGTDPSRKDEIDLPWGSLFVRYLFNQIETVEPFADNIKPQTRYVRWLLSHHPMTALHFLLGSGRYMFAKMARAWRTVPASAFAERKAAHHRRLRELAAEAGIAEAELEYLDSRRSASVLREPAGKWKIVAWFTRNWILSLVLAGLLLLLAVGVVILVGAHLLSPLVPWSIRGFLGMEWSATGSESAARVVLSIVRWPIFVLTVGAILVLLRLLLKGETKPGLTDLARHAQMIRERLQVRYVTMGHTHEVDLQSTGEKGGEYFNTGTWTKVFDEEEQLLREESELVFLQALRRPDGLKVRLLKWNDGADEPRLVKLFD